MALQARDDSLRHGVVRPALTRFCLMLNELGGAVGGGGSARNAEVEFGPYTKRAIEGNPRGRCQTRRGRLRDASSATTAPGRPGKGAREAATLPPPWAEHTAAYGRPELACNTSRLKPERRRATRPPSGLDCPLHHPSGRDPTVPRTAGRTKNGRSPDGLGGGRASPASSGRCTSSFACIVWRPTGAIGVAKECSDA